MLKGLLDNMPAMDTPEGQGLLQAAFSLMSAQKYPGQKGALAGALGDAGRSYLQTTNQSRDQMMRRKMLDAQMEAQQMQLEAARRQQAERERMEAAIRDQFSPMGASQAMAGGGGPTVANAQRMGQMPQFDPLALLRSGGVGALEQGLKIKDAITPKPKAPLKLGENDRLLDPDTYKELVSPVQKPQVIDYNKPFLPDGTPNKAYQEYDITKARSGASRITVKTPFETEFNKKSGGNFAEMYGSINQQGFRAPAQTRNLERIEQLLEGVDGGRLAPTGMELASIANSFGVKVDPKLGNKQAAESLTREMALGMREPGTGPMTDKDFQNFMDIAPGLSKTAEGRKQIITTMKNKLARDVKISKMARDYVRRKGTMDEGFLDEASEFMSQNPVVAQPKGYRVQRLP